MVLSGNPLTIFVLSELLAATRLDGLVASLPNQGVSVFTYPLAVILLKPNQTLDEAYEFTLAGPPGTYAIETSTNLIAWGKLTVVTNEFGSAAFTDVTPNLSPHNYYRARSRLEPDSF
jgi:hypothetical protein